MDKVLAQTPEMLPVLKQAGVVDAGGRGLLHILEGALKQLGGDLPVTPAGRTERSSRTRNEFRFSGICGK